MLERLLSISLALFPLVGCASINNPPDSPLDVEITDLPDVCDGLLLKVTVCQGDKSYTFTAEPASGGTIEWGGYESEAGQKIDLDPEAKIVVKAKIIVMSEECEAALEAHLGKDLEEGSSGQTGQLCPVGYGEWEAKVGDISF
jgi:hypothetical protein